MEAPGRSVCTMKPTQNEGEVDHSGDHVGRQDSDGLGLNTDDRIRRFILWFLERLADV